MRVQLISTESMNRLIPIRIHVALGLLVTLVGITVLTSASMNPSGLQAWFPPLGGMSFVTAACFVLAGSALWFPLNDAHRSGYRRVIGILLCLIGSLVLIHFLGVMAEPFPGFIKPDANGFPWPGRVSRATAASFLIVGLVLILLDSSSNFRKLVLMQFGLATIATLAIMAVLGHVLGVDLFFDRFPEVSLMSFPTALTLLLLSLGLVGKIVESASFQTFFAGRDDLKVFALSILLLYCPILAAGMVGMGLVAMMDASEIYQPLRERLLATLFVLVALALLGVLLFFNRVYPIVRKLDFAKSQLAETLDNLPESVITINMQGIVQNASASTQDLFGYAPAELIGRNLDLLIPESARKRHSGYFSGDLRSEADRDRVIGVGPREMKALHRDGRQFPIEIAVSQFLFQGERIFIAIARDISERRRTELALLNSRQQLRAMSAYQEALLEGERKHIAREVHDELGQLLTALKMDISLLRLRFGGDPGLRQKAEEMRALVENTIDVVRHVASNLRPAALDHGIVPAIEWLAEDFSHRWEMSCAVSVQGEEVVLDDALATVVFRVVQESLTNVARHAQASEVMISLRRGDQGLSLLVQDNGRGFDPAVVRRTRGFGLLGMRERVLALGGTLHIDGVPGKGTTVTIELPLHSDENP